VNEAFYRQTSRVEDRHWWFVHRRRLVADLLSLSLRHERAGRRALDIGCGSGGNLSLLAHFCAEVVGLDRSAIALDLARRKHPDAQLVQGDALALRDLFPAAGFDLISIFNVLYHRWVVDEASALDQVAASLRPGGLLVITEPAHPRLMRRHDVVDWGRCRYSRSGLTRLIERSGLELLGLSSFNTPSLPFAAVGSLLHRSGRSDDSREATTGELTLPPALLNRLLLGIVSLERGWVLRMNGWSGGLTWLALARRPVSTS